jgi:hypothetical protein
MFKSWIHAVAAIAAGLLIWAAIALVIIKLV